VPRKHVELRVVRREDDGLAKRGEELDERRFVGAHVRRDAPVRVPRSEPERTRPVIHSEHVHTGAAERPNRREPVHPANVNDRRGELRITICAWHEM
jgi:hypothetical protein